MRPKSYREVVPEQRCGNCQHCLGVLYPNCCLNKPIPVSRNFGICDHWKPREVIKSATVEVSEPDGSTKTIRTVFCPEGLFTSKKREHRGTNPMSKINEIAEKAAMDRFPDVTEQTSAGRFDLYKESEIQSIKQDAFAEGYRKAVAEISPVVKPEDLQNGLYYWNSDNGGLDWTIGFAKTRSYSTPLLCVHGHDYPVFQTDLLRGPILSPDELGRT